MPLRHQTIPRTLCFITHENKLLLIEFGESKGEMRGYYNCPGGHIEQGEGIVESATREILEETGLTLPDTSLVGVVHVSNFFGGNMMMFVTHSHADTLEVIECDEGKLHWVDMDKLNNLRIFEDVKLIIPHIEQGKIFTAKSVFDGGGKLISMTFEK